MKMLRLSAIVSFALLIAFGPALRAQDAQEPQEQAAKGPTLPAKWVDTLQWRSIGPANMGGRITAIAVYEKDPSTYWVASASGGLLKTTNNGITFEHQFDHEATVSIGDVQVAASDPNIVWVGTGEANPRNSSSWGDGVYKSTDGGKSWTNMGLKKGFQTGRIAIHPKDPNIVYAGVLGRLWGPNVERGLFKSTDGGKNWKKILYIDDKTGVVDVQMHPNDPDTLMVATYERERDGHDSNDPAKKLGPGSGLYRTTDGGRTFEEITEGLPTCKLGRIGINYYRADPKIVTIVLESEKIGKEPPNAPFAGFRGEDADVGARLTQITADSPAEKAGLKEGDIILSFNGKTVHSYQELQKAIRQHVAGETATLELSRDRKSVEVEITFSKRPERPTGGGGGRRGGFRGGRGARNPFQGGLGGQRENLQDQQGKDGFEYGGIYQSADGGTTWKRINSVNPRPMYYSQVRVDPSDRNHVWVLGTRLYRSKDGGTTFTSDGARRGVHVDHHAMWIDPNDGRHIILGNDGGLYVTYDRGANWDHHNHFAIGQFYHVGVGPRRNYRVYGGLQDNGSWGGPSRVRNGRGPVNSDWFSIGGGDGFICLVDPDDPDLVYFESQNGSMGNRNLRTGQRGSARPGRQRGGRGGGGERTRYRFNWKTPFVLSNHNPKIFYAAGNYVFRSLNKGQGMRVISPEISLTDRGSGSAIAESPRDEGVIYVGTTDGALWVTRNGGQEWTNLYEMTAAETRAAAERRDPAAGGGRRGFGQGRMIQFLLRNDENGDGKIQKSEVPERMMRMFERFDTNKDGVIDKKEIEAQRGTRSDDDPPEPPRSAPQDDPITGTWTGKFLSGEIPEERSSFTLVLKLGDDGKVTGTFESAMSEGEVEGKYDADSKKLTVTVETRRNSIELTAPISGTTMKGEVEMFGGAFTLDFEATRTRGGGGGEAPAREEFAAGKPIKELLPGPRWVSSIETSRASAGRAYVTFDGHRSNDDEPYVFVTEDYGQTWRSLRANLATSAGSTRVVREDVRNPNMLYLGTEFAAWVSIDRGESWTKLNSNLPTVAVHEIAIHPTAGEIVAGTHGRSLWVLDVSALRQMSADTVAADATLYKPQSAIRWRSQPRRGNHGLRSFTGQNPENSASIYYSLGRDAGEVKVKITDLQGKIVRELEAKTEAGLHRLTWDLRRTPPTRRGGVQGRRGGGRFGGGGFRGGRFRGRGGRAVLNGTYLVTLTVDGTEHKQELTIEADPDFPDTGMTEEEEEFESPNEEEEGNDGPLDRDD